MVADEHLSDEQLQLYRKHHAPAVELKDFHLHLEWCDYCGRRLMSMYAQAMNLKSKQTGGTGTLPQTETEPASSMSNSFEIKSDSTDILSTLQTLPGYTNVRALTQGGMGAVYLAHSTSFNREEVLKVVIPSHRQNSGAMSRFKQEIEVIGRLNHPNIVTPYATYEVGGLLVLSMEFAGENLEQFVKRKESLSVADACRYIIQVAKGLQHAYEKQVVHRDIKPSNILMTQLGNKPMLKIVDFGLGKAHAEDMESRLLSGGLTPDETGMGTPAYMSPEQARDSKNADIRTDIYALGCTLYFLLTKHPPFQKDSLAGYLFAHAQDEPPLLHELRSDIPEELSKIALKMLAKDPDERYQTPAEIIRELAPFTLSESTIDWKPPAQGEPRRVKSRVPMLVGLLALFIGSIAIAASTLFIKTRDGTIELTNLSEDVEVLVDGDVVNLKWAGGKQSAEIRVKPGTHKLELKQNGITVLGETVNIVQDGRTVVDGKLTVHASGPFLEVHGVTKATLESWIAKLPKNFRPSWIASRTGAKEPTFEGIAVPVTEVCDTKFVTWSENMVPAEYIELKKTHRLIIDTPYLMNNGYHSIIVGVQDGKSWETWWGNLDFVSGKIAEGLKHERITNGVVERWLPHSLSAIRHPDGTLIYSLLSSWQPDKGAMEWHPALNPKELATKIAEYRAKGWRPHIINTIHGSQETAFLAVFLENKSKEIWDFSPNLTAAEYEQQLVDRKALNQRPRCVCSHVTDNKVTFTVVWEDLNPKPVEVKAKSESLIAETKPSPTPAKTTPTPIPVIPKPSTPPPLPRPEFVPLFNGKDLTGWEQLGDEVATWKVVNKILVGSFPEDVGGNSLLKTVRSDFRNFHLRIVAMKSERWGSRINLFTPPNGPRIGAARIRVSLGSPQNNVDEEFGRLSFMSKGDNTVMPLTNKVKIVEKQWYTLDIVYQQGKRITVEVNGVKTADVSDQLKGPNMKTDIRLSLGASVARFKSIEIKELP